MELWRKKNVDTRILFPLVDADGDFVTGAAGLDSEWVSYDTADHGGAEPSFQDCTHEATEIGTTGIYYLDLQGAEVNKDFTLILIKTSTSGAKTQAILITTRMQDADLINIAGAAVSESTSQLGVNVVKVSGDSGAADNLEAACDGNQDRLCSHVCL
jgi:hypothetical protein